MRLRSTQRARGLLDDAAQRRGSAAGGVPAAGLRRGLHRVRPLRRDLPGQRSGRPGPQGDQPRPARRPAVQPAAQHRVLRDAAGQRPRAGRLRDRPRHPVPPAVVRVPGRVRRLRGDALHQAAHPAVRRAGDRRQRHRLLLDLRRQPADHAVDQERRGSRAGLVQLPVRGQRRVRPGPAPGRRPAHQAGPRAPQRAARRSSAPTSPTRSSTPAQVRESELARAAGAGGRADADGSRA